MLCSDLRCATIHSLTFSNAAPSSDTASRGSEVRNWPIGQPITCDMEAL